MSIPSTAALSSSVFRVDRFVVPAEALPAFLDKVRGTQRTLDTLAGCRQNLVLSRTGGGGEFNVVTVVEWASAEAMAAAQVVMQRKYAEEGFEPGAFMHSLGVRADMGVYRDA